MVDHFLALLQAFFSILSPCPEMEGCVGCGKNDFEIVKIGQLPAQIEESSGLVVYNQLLFTNSDSGNEPSLFGVSSPFIDKPEVQGYLQFPDSIANNDWEDLAIDSSSFIYIGDFGNNSNARRNLSILKFDPLSGNHEQIFFSYEDQQAFPPRRRKDRNFDCEAFFWAKDSLFLFSKNKKSKEVKIYTLPDTAGNHLAKITTTIKLDYPITSADISPDGRMLVLLSYGKVFLYTVEWTSENTPLLHPFTCVPFRHSGQAEAIAFINDSNWIITNEGGEIFWMKAQYDLLPPLEHPVPAVQLLPGMSGMRTGIE